MSSKSSHKLVLFFAISCHLLQEKFTEASVLCKESEKKALLEFKHSLQAMDSSGDDALFLWETEECCFWRGVECNILTGYVEILDFSLQSWVVAGTISPSLLKLHHLTSLNFNNNDFNGSLIPEVFGSLKKLKLLDLSNANFRGPIPSLLGNLSMLETLRLGEVDLSFTNLSNANDWSQVISHLPLLQKLSLRHRDLPSISSSSLSLANSSISLTYLDLSDNNLPSSAIYPWLFNVSSNLVSLNLSSNKLKGPIPEAFGNMKAIQELYLNDNLLVLAENQVRGDSGLNEIGKLPDFRVLDLGYNLLNGPISKSIGQLSNLHVLRLAGNFFDGDVISEAHLSNFTNLQVLDLSSTSLTLKFNTGWIPPFHLSQMMLCSCKLGPRFPDWLLANMDFRLGLEYLDISALGISDSLPYWFWDSLYGLRYLNMSFNQISGTFPNKSIHISHLDLSSNNFSGPLPHFSLDFGAIGRFGTINLSRNKFNGSVSPICNITNKVPLALLDLSNNQFSGVVPDCFHSFRSLTALNLGDSSFSGSLPSSLGSLTSLEMLSLHGNKFSGELPLYLQNCTELKFLDLSDNELSGEIPMWLGQRLSSLVFLSLQRNQFRGRIPHQLCELKYLQILDLSVNKISDSIPPCLKNFNSMAKKVSLDRRIFELHLFDQPYVRSLIDVRYVDEALITWKGTKQNYPQLGLLLAIDLSCNKLTGEIPEELISLQELVALNLSRNFFTGKILQKVGHLRQLEVLDLSRNKFSGNIPTSLSELTFLSILDLSYNDLSGKIPTSTQLQSFDPSSFSHNRGLCGPPVSPNCSMVEPPPGKPAVGGEKDSDDQVMKWFYICMGLGFVVGFWGFCSVVFFMRSWRHSYYRYLDSAKDWVYVSFVLLKARLVRRIKGLSTRSGLIRTATEGDISCT
ncbi:hypothetical protein ES288_D05G425200v1 [Gossypium darwinii]|uniref:Leucine-rich repeat-containing N-terminal plant-type domain-containing protein n=1 Tax=Gossypium darwinii TaxID=34276 RepID=A0A5D2CQA2_GOSDA|nr:hypothetical protein ES288_D05G425200v1 [Gossypium darwinii]